MTDELDQLRQRAAADPELPEIVRGFLERGAPLVAIELDARGRWWHEGGRFEHPRLIAEFSRHLRRTTAGTWTVTLGPYTYPVTVRGCGRFVRAAALDRPPHLLTLLDGTTEPLDPGTLCTDGDTFLGCRLGDGYDARLVEGAYQAALDRLEQGDGGWVLDVGGHPYPVGPLPAGHPHRAEAAG